MRSRLHRLKSPHLKSRKGRLPVTSDDRRHFKPDGRNGLALWGGLTLSSMLGHLYLSCSPQMWPQHLQSLFTGFLGMERMSRMSCVSHRGRLWEASYQLGSKDSCRHISGAKDQQEWRRLSTSQWGAEDVLSEWRRAHLSCLPDIKPAQSSWVLPAGGGGPTEEGRVKIETWK